MLGRLITIFAGAALLAGCAAAPRGSAANLATAGVKATGAFSAQVKDVATQINNVSVNEAFARTWEACSSQFSDCPPKPEPPEASQLRRDLANVIALRARAIDALGAAYSALATEAEYDGAADLKSAADAAVKSANAFAEAAAALPVPGGGAAAPLISDTVGGLIGFGAEIIGEHRQRKRILAASRVIGAATKQLRDGMRREAHVFDSMTNYIILTRTQARLDFLDAGLTSGSTLMKPLADQLGLPLVGSSESIIQTRPVREALKEVMRASARQEMMDVQGRYRSALGALDALLASHAQLEAGEPISIVDVERFLARLNASLDAPPPQQGN